MAVRHLPGLRAHKKELTSLLRENARRHRLHEVFSDFCELGALAISNSVDLRQYEAREARYMQIVARYARAEVDRFPQMFAVLVDWLSCGFADCLGELFMSLELGDHWKGQFFTPYPVSSLMAGVSMGDARQHIERDGFITVCEPACGAGGMAIACAEAVMLQGVNFQKAMHVTAIDSAHWVTPAHVLGNWDWRLRSRASERGATKVAHEVPSLVNANECADAVPVQEVRAAVIAHRLDQLDLSSA